MTLTSAHRTAERSRERARLASLALFTGPLLLIEVAVNTVLSHGYLSEHGWRLRGGENVPWPSMLALGPHGYAQILAFAMAGLGVLALIPGLAATLPRQAGRRPTLTLVAVWGTAVFLSAAPLDAAMIAQGNPVTWHGAIHGLMFVVLLPATLLTPLALALATRRDTSWRAVRRISAWTPALALTALVSGQGNLGFYLYLCIVFGWTMIVAHRVTRG